MTEDGSRYGVPYVPDAAIEHARDAAVEVIGEHLAAQPWWKRRANTVVVAVTMVAAAVGSVGVDQVFGTQFGAWITMLVGAAVSVVAVANTKNGVTPIDAQLAAEVVSDPRVIAPLATPPSSSGATQ